LQAYFCKALAFLNDEVHFVCFRICYLVYAGSLSNLTIWSRS